MPRQHGGGWKPGSKASNAYRERLRAAVGVFKALLLFGCRRGEVLDLRWSDVDVRRGVVRIRLPKTLRRGLPQKELPLVAGIKKVIDLQVRRVGIAHVFQRPGGGPWEERKLRNAFALAKTLSGLDEPEGTPATARLVLHSLRHTTETWLARAGFSDSLRNAYLGHADGSMSATYTHLAPADLIPLVERLTVEAEKGAAGDAETESPGQARR
jgi:integrase